MNIDAKQFTKEWIEAWNSHDLERILSHYSEDFSITSPMISIVMKIDESTLFGKNNIKAYWFAALQKFPNLNFELKEVASSVNSIAVYYQSVIGKVAIEVMFFNEQGKVNKVISHYTN
ncbi:MAG: nuclear transport factor 2 family protein [Methylococcaceae bacterium]|nr:MAG: nuclear transport factor 2 family protein [Methylococcaceae bacterium]